MHLFKTISGYNYKPAVLKKEVAWRIVYYAYCPKLKKSKRINERYGLNRIKDLKEREKKATKIVAEINARLPYDFPFVRTDFPLVTDSTFQKHQLDSANFANQQIMPLSKNVDMMAQFADMLLNKVGDLIDARVGEQLPKKEEVRQPEIEKIKILDAIKDAYKFKYTTKSELSEASNKSRKKLFEEWLELKKLDKIYVHEFTDRHARDYMDMWEFEKNVADSTFTNKLTFVKGLFQEIVERTDFIDKNPFAKIKTKKRRRKIIDFLSDEEMKGISEYYRINRPWMYKAMLLQFFCWIRPVELRKLKFGMFDLVKGQIRYKGKDTKNNEDDNITIQKAIINEFRNSEFASYPAHWFVFGRHLKPSDTRCGTGSMNGLHNAILTKLGLNRTGVFWYLWKHMGVTILSEKEGLTPMEMMKHGRWKDLNVIHHYLHNTGKVMPNIKKIEHRYI